jgi:hypothetical protein
MSRKKYFSSFMLTWRSKSGFSRDKPTDVNLDFNPGQFYSSTFDGFNLEGREGFEVAFLARYFWIRNAATTEKHWFFSIGFHRPFKQT